MRRLTLLIGDEKNSDRQAEERWKKWPQPQPIRHSDFIIVIVRVHSCLFVVKR